MPPCIIVILFVFESHVVYCVNLRKEIKLKLKLNNAFRDEKELLLTVAVYQ